MDGLLAYVVDLQLYPTDGVVRDPCRIPNFR